MTPAQREAAIELMARAMADEYAVVGTAFLEDAESALDALTEEFVVLHRDDVTEERGDSPATNHLRRLVTRWEPITKEDTDA